MRVVTSNLTLIPSTSPYFGHPVRIFELRLRVTILDNNTGVILSLFFLSESSSTSSYLLLRTHAAHECSWYLRREQFSIDCRVQFPPTKTSTYAYQGSNLIWSLSDGIRRASYWGFQSRIVWNTVIRSRITTRSWFWSKLKLVACHIVCGRNPQASITSSPAARLRTKPADVGMGLSKP